MNEEKIRKMVSDSFFENIMNNLDSSIIFKYIEGLEKENQELKKQLENCYCNRTDCSSRIKDSKKYDSLVQKVEKQQKEFIEWLKSEIKECKDVEEKYADGDDNSYYNNNELRIEILSKYKEIIGGKDE